ncbi:MAG: hypothetical protein HN742_23875 [Lentisphaerae bacterium]|nr:hypothetical protein [Lentisphaerota bacterium]MBT4817786.1 hypothetical protein [Lentisphaerota bacterium]MBT5612791.1 hypothetical protein [Lentisphaerota bacterium]MBT7057617.1 hypothetical protein [Lentisphaerota bacterium]MBT7844936.1 hypothetical protein [Lentisphaerota bacterium]
MSFLTSFNPFRRKKSDPKLPKPKFDVQRALDVEVHAHPSLEQHRAANGELMVMIRRHVFPAERWLGRWFKLNQRRRLLLDQHGEFVLTHSLRDGATLRNVADEMATEFEWDKERAELGVIHLVKALMLREFVFLVRRKESGQDESIESIGAER